jgi:hypothetical protein
MYAIMFEESPVPSSFMTYTKISNNEGQWVEKLALTAIMFPFFATPKLFDAAIPAT